MTKRDMLIDWLNAFKADPFSTGADKVDRLLEITALAAGSGTAETNKDLAQCEASQSGPKGNAQ